MMLFHQIFSNEVKSANQWNFAHELGLSEETFVFSEHLPETTLRVLRFQNKRVNAVLDSNVITDCPKVELHHAVLFPECDPKSEKSLTKWLLPFPLYTILSKVLESDVKLSFSEGSFRERCEKLRGLFEQLESALTQNEIACLQIPKQDPPSAFLFHSVRGKIIRTSFFPAFSLAEHQKNLSQTSYSVISLPPDNPLNLKGFELAF
ncbi:MAG: hypothetical protein ACKN9V_06620, partial [Pseudomonadota bacterium]